MSAPSADTPCIRCGQPLGPQEATNWALWHGGDAACLQALQARCGALAAALTWALTALGDPPNFTGDRADWQAACRLVGRWADGPCVWCSRCPPGQPCDPACPICHPAGEAQEGQREAW